MIVTKTMNTIRMRGLLFVLMSIIMPSFVVLVKAHDDKARSILDGVIKTIMRDNGYALIVKGLGNWGTIFAFLLVTRDLSKYIVS
jgi:hypothetical protein